MDIIIIIIIISKCLYLFSFPTLKAHIYKFSRLSFIHFCKKLSWENLFKDQSIFLLLINFLILTTFSLDNILKLLWENWFWSLFIEQQQTWSGLQKINDLYFKKYRQIRSQPLESPLKMKNQKIRQEHIMLTFNLINFLSLFAYLGIQSKASLQNGTSLK